MKKIVIAERTLMISPELADAAIREQVSLPGVLPIEGWRREGGVVEISSERFPGSQPVWIWIEK